MAEPQQHLQQQQQQQQQQHQQLEAPITLPRVTITFCTQCKWLLRAAYYAQELLSTFGPALGEVSLRPATGGLFTIDLTYRAAAATTNDDDPAAADPAVRHVLLWDRKTDGGFPETKILKQRVRDWIEPGRNLGHVDTPASRKGEEGQGAGAEEGREGQVVDASGARALPDRTREGVGQCEDCA